ncbi:MAG: hypothetical protein ACAI43_20320 [Phycisphaerae bacterium]
MPDYVCSRPEETLRRSFARLIVVTIGLSLILGLLLVVRGRVDITDDPATIARVSDDGVVTLETRRGTVMRPLARVVWRRDDPRFVRAAQSVIHEAQAGNVAWAERKDGLRIWYQPDQDTLEVNAEIRRRAEAAQ